MQEDFKVNLPKRGNMTEYLESSTEQEAGQIKEKDEQKGFDALFEMAQEIQDEATENEQIKLQTEELRQKETEKIMREKQIEQGIDDALESGKIYYQQLTDPEQYEIDRKKPENQWQKNPKNYYGTLYGDSNDIRAGKIYSHFPEYNGWHEVGAITKSSDFLGVISESMEKDIFRSKAETDHLIEMRKTGKDIPWWGALDTPEKIQAEVDRLEGIEKNSTEQKRLSVKKRVEGFGRAALKHNDIEIAIDNLNFAKVLESQDVVEILTKQITELKSSTNPEDRIKLQKIARKLTEIRK